MGALPYCLKLVRSTLAYVGAAVMDACGSYDNIKQNPHSVAWKVWWGLLGLKHQ